MSNDDPAINLARAAYQSAISAFNRAMIAAETARDKTALKLAKADYDKAMAVYDKAMKEWTAEDIIKRSA